MVSKICSLLCTIFVLSMLQPKMENCHPSSPTSSVGRNEALCSVGRQYTCPRAETAHALGHYSFQIGANASRRDQKSSSIEQKTDSHLYQDQCPLSEYHLSIVFSPPRNVSPSCLRTASVKLTSVSFMLPHFSSVAHL